MRALVTGGAGFIGFHLVKHLLAEGRDVTVIDNLFRGKADCEFNEILPKIHFINADMRKSDFVNELSGKYDEVYHLAAINGTENFYKIPDKVLEVNILSLINMLNWANADTCGKFLFTSSSEAYAGTISVFDSDNRFVPTKEDVPLCVDDVFNARWSYGGSKLIGEILTINFLRQKNVPFSVTRYHNVYGPRMGFEHVIPQFCERIIKKTSPFPIYGGNETRAFCYVDDAVRATRLVMETAKADGELVHIGNQNEEIKIVDMAKQLTEIAKYSADFDIKAAPDGCVKRRCPDTEKLTGLTGYIPEIPLKKGLAFIYEWYANYYNTNER